MKTMVAAMLCAGLLAVDEPRPIVDFQRAADAYAFLHRQVERQVGGDPAALAAGIIAARTRANAAPLFTPEVVAAFRGRAADAIHRGCDAGELRTGVWELSHEPYTPATGSRPVSACLLAALPDLPDELEYRSAGTVLLLVDHHANLVVDVLPALLAGSDLR
jgi:hypothetical protein